MKKMVIAAVISFLSVSLHAQFIGGYEVAHSSTSKRNFKSVTKKVKGDAPTFTLINELDAISHQNDLLTTYVLSLHSYLPPNKRSQSKELLQKSNQHLQVIGENCSLSSLTKEELSYFFQLVEKNALLKQNILEILTTDVFEDNQTLVDALLQSEDALSGVINKLSSDSLIVDSQINGYSMRLNSLYELLKSFPEESTLKSYKNDKKIIVEINQDVLFDENKANSYGKTALICLSTFVKNNHEFCLDMRYDTSLTEHATTEMNKLIDYFRKSIYSTNFKVSDFKNDKENKEKIVFIINKIN